MTVKEPRVQKRVTVVLILLNQIIKNRLQLQMHSPVNRVGFCLCWVLNVRLIQQLLDPQQDLDTQSTYIHLLCNNKDNRKAWLCEDKPV